MTEPTPEKSPEIIKPWYKQFWPWFLIGLLAYSVVQGLTLLTIATKNPPGLISDDYYDVGKGINQSLERENHATRLKLNASLLLNDDNGTATLQLQADGSYSGQMIDAVEGRRFVELIGQEGGKDWRLFEEETVQSGKDIILGDAQ
jgi:hypothetical protein